jgi:2-iminobutanoate/2-iminopropanoate deaminase
MKRIAAGKAWEPQMRFAPAIRIDPAPLVFTSGITGRGLDGRIVDGGMGKQAQQAFQNISDLLEAAGSSMNHIVKLTYYVADMDRWEEVAAARAAFFQGPLPASSTVEVSRLWDTACLVEIEAIAVIEQGKSS